MSSDIKVINKTLVLHRYIGDYDAFKDNRQLYTTFINIDDILRLDRNKDRYINVIELYSNGKIQTLEVNYYISDDDYRKLTAEIAKNRSK